MCECVLSTVGSNVCMFAIFDRQQCANECYHLKIAICDDVYFLFQWTAMCQCVLYLCQIASANVCYLRQKAMCESVNDINNTESDNI